MHREGARTVTLEGAGSHALAFDEVPNILVFTRGNNFQIQKRIFINFQDFIQNAYKKCYNFPMKKLSEEQIVKTACASVVMEGLPLPENFEQKLSDYNNGIITEEEVLKDEN